MILKFVAKHCTDIVLLWYKWMYRELKPANEWHVPLHMEIVFFSMALNLLIMPLFRFNETDFISYISREFVCFAVSVWSMSLHIRYNNVIVMFCRGFQVGHLRSTEVRIWISCEYNNTRCKLRLDELHTCAFCGYTSESIRTLFVHCWEGQRSFEDNRSKTVKKTCKHDNSNS